MINDDLGLRFIFGAFDFTLAKASGTHFAPFSEFGSKAIKMSAKISAQVL